jgi:hypothetical protein
LHNTRLVPVLVRVRARSRITRLADGPIQGIVRGDGVGEYLRKYLPEAIAKRNVLADYRTNPYVLMTSASVMSLSDVQRLASFIFDNKLYMGLETSFGKSIESIVTKFYPTENACFWASESVSAWLCVGLT